MISPRIVEIRRLYAEAESALKRYERIGLDNLVPVVNELRYAGEHILTAETTEDPAIIETALSRAERHCVRARYDALESTLITLLQQISGLRESALSADEIESLFPEWKSVLKDATAALKFVETAGAVRDVEPSKLESAIDSLLNWRYRLLEIEPEIVAKRNEALACRENEQRQHAKELADEKTRIGCAEKAMADRQFLLSFSATIAGTAVGLVGTLLAITTAFPTQRLVGILLGLFGFAVVCFVVYRWSSKNLLSK